MIEDNFSSSNMMALVVPRGDYEKEAQLLKELESYDEVDYTMGLANIDALDGYKLADKLTPRQFAELAGLDYEAAQVVYAAYAAENESYGELVGNIATYKVPLIDMFLYVCDKVDSGVVTLSDEQTDMLHDAEVQMTSAKNQLQGETYSRMLLYLTLPVSGDETYHFTDKILEIARSYYPDEDVFLAGNSTNEYDFEKSFAVDNTVVSIVSVLIVLVVLLFTFNSAGMPLLLILVSRHGTGGTSSVAGDVLCVISAVSYATYLTAFRNVIVKYSPVTTMKWMFLFAAVAAVAIYYRPLAEVDYAALAPRTWAGIGYVVVCSTFLSYFMVPVGQRYLRPTVVSMYNYVQPLVAVLFTVAVGLDTFGFTKGVAALCVFAGVWLVTKSKSRAQLDAERAAAEQAPENRPRA